MFDSQENERMTPVRKSVVITACVACYSVWPAAQASRPLPDFAKARAEAVQTLQGLIRLDTSNPPGNESRAVEYIKRILDREGIESETFMRDEGRGSIVARLKGTGRRRPILLMAHTDVVGVEREKWSVDPFAAVVRDGHVYGRGAIDDKDTVAAALVVFLSLHRLRVPLDRDVIFLAEAGEEGTPEVGITYMVDRHWTAIEAEYAIAEGGEIPVRDGRVRYVGVATTEKVPHTLRLVARGTSGHGSMPRLDNPIVHLAAAVAKIGAFQPAMRLNDTTRAFFERTAKISAPDEVFQLTHLDDPTVQDTLRRTNVTYNSMLRTSISPNILKGGFRVNVIPGDAEATLDVRALPGEDVDALIAQLGALIDDPAVEVVHTPPNRPSAPPSALDSELFRALERSGQTVYPNAPTIPMMLTGATDMAQLRAKGVKAYGVSEPTDERDPSAHGNDERVSIEALGKYVEYIYRAVLEVAAAP
jgi:acetylornithine deacetylase/succinyl-diaminopimelate desuccinylase-like protein